MTWLSDRQNDSYRVANDFVAVGHGDTVLVLMLRRFLKEHRLTM